MFKIDNTNIKLRNSKTPVSFSINRATMMQLAEIQEAIKLEQSRHMSRTALVEYAVNELYHNINNVDDLTSIQNVGDKLE